MNRVDRNLAGVAHLDGDSANALKRKVRMTSKSRGALALLTRPKILFQVGVSAEYKPIRNAIAKRAHGVLVF
jgi:hypothetical protein